MNAKMLVATRPGATSGNRIRQKITTELAPSIAAASSSSLGTVATKFRSIQIDTGSACAAYTMTSPPRFCSSPSRLKSTNSAMISACPGIICTISSTMSSEVRNRNLATATEASSESSDASRTVTRVTARLLRKNSQTEPMPDARPLITCVRLACCLPGQLSGSSGGRDDPDGQRGRRAVLRPDTAAAAVTRPGGTMLLPAAA